MANSSNQGCTSVPDVANSPLSPKFLSLMKSAGKAKFDAELFVSKIDLLARQYFQGFDEILRQGAHETRDEVICDIVTEMDMEVSIFLVKLEDFKAKLKTESEDQDNDGPSNDGSLLGDSPVGIQEFREGMMQLQQQIRTMDGSNTVFQKRYEDATARNEELVQEVRASQKQLGEAVESIRKLKDGMEQRPVPPVVARADESVQTDDEDFQTMCAQLEKDYEKFMERCYEHYGHSMCSAREELLEEMRVLNAKLEACEQAYSPADIQRARFFAGLKNKRSILTAVSCTLKQPTFRAIDHLYAMIEPGQSTTT